MPDNDIQAISTVFKHLGLSHNDVTLPSMNGRPAKRVPAECVYAYCTCEWSGPDALVDTPWGLFLVATTDNGFAVVSRGS